MSVVEDAVNRRPVKNEDKFALNFRYLAHLEVIELATECIYRGNKRIWLTRHSRAVKDSPIRQFGIGCDGSLWNYNIPVSLSDSRSLRSRPRLSIAVNC